MAEKQRGAAAKDAPTKHDVPAPAGSADAGVGTGVEAPKDETPRGQARMHIGAGHVAAPIEAPDAAAQTDPPEGHANSSTNPVAALVGLQTYTGENHVRYVDEDGKDLSVDAIFEPAQENQTSRIVKQGVYEVFNYPGSQEPMSRRLFHKGQRVSLTTAAQITHVTSLGEAQLRQESKRVEAEAARFHGES